MRIIARRTLRDYWEKHPSAEQVLKSWFREASAAIWNEPADVKARYRSASIIGGNRVVFNIGGNKYRLITQINYSFKIVYIRFIGSHAAYDKINAETI